MHNNFLEVNSGGDVVFLCFSNYIVDSYVICFLRAIFFDLNELKKINELLLINKKIQITTLFL